MSRGQRIIASLLTVNAVLLGGLLWVQIAEKPVFAESAYAQRGGQLPNAGAQRDLMIQQLTQIQQATQATQKVLESGTVKVVITQPPKTKKR